MKPVLAQKTVRSFDKVVFGFGASRPYLPVALLYNVTVTFKGKFGDPHIDILLQGTLPNGKKVSFENFVYKKGGSPYKFGIGRGAPLKGVDIFSAYHFLFDDPSRSEKYNCPPIDPTDMEVSWKTDW